MVALSRCLGSAALFVVGVDGARIARKKADNEDQLITMNGCQVPNLVFQGLRSMVNGAWAKLEPHDPATFKIAGNNNFDIKGCNLKLDASANISLTGFSEGGIRQLECTSSQCLQRASDGSCAMTEYSFSAHLAVGDCKDTLAVAGGVDADFAACGYDIPRAVVDASFDSVGPGVKVDLSVQHGSAGAKISKVNTLDLSWGVPTNYKCGFELMGVPALIGGVLSDYCVSLMNWVGNKVQGHLEEDMSKLIAELLDQQVLQPPPPPAQCPFYCGMRLCLLDACVNNCDYCSSRSSTEELEQQAVAAVPTPKAQSYDAQDDMVAFNGCQVPSLVFQGVRNLVNNAWGNLEPYDPAVLSVAGKKSFSIASCDLKLDASANISVTGFSDGGIRQLACTSSKVLADGVTEYSFSAHLSVGDCKDTLAIAGGVDADFALCGLDIPRTVVDASFDSVGPGVKVDLSVQHSGGVNAKISKVNTLDLSLGEPTNYKCGFEVMGVPGFVGDLLADYCVSLMNWVADKIQGRLESDGEKLIKDLLNKAVL